MYSVDIDILNDSVNDICDKLFYEATGGKFIDYAWDAPQPAAVNPLSVDEVKEWGNSAMTIEFPRAANNPVRLGRRKVSAIKKFVQRSSAQPFYGYRSEPPKARAFDIEEPMGPMAKALKAAGTLSALCEREGEDSTGIWNLLEGTWGDIPDSAKAVSKPDLSVASDTDLIKLVRSPMHMLFGFNSRAPATSVDLGKYRSETIVGNYMIDWHALVISLRFIGETIARYGDIEVNPWSKIRFSPVLSETRLMSYPSYAITPMEPILMNCDADLATIKAATLRELTIGLASTKTRSEIVSSRAVVKLDLGDEMTDRVISQVNATFANRYVNLPPDVATRYTEAPAYDLAGKTPGAFKRSILASMNKLDLAWVPTWVGVHTSVWVAAFTSSDFRSSALISIMRRIGRYDTDDPEVNKQLALKVSKLLPAGIGHVIYVMLKHMIPSTQDAVAEYVKMIMTISGGTDVDPAMNAANSYRAAVANSSSISEFITRLNMAHSSYQSRSHGSTKLLEYVKCNELSVTGLTRAFSKFMHERLSYWKTHYTSRVADSRDELVLVKETLKLTADAKMRGNVHVRELVMKASRYKGLSTKDLKAKVAELKADVIKYAFASSCYSRAKVSITDDLDPRLYITPSDLRAILLKSADSYIRKRSTWGRRLALDSKLYTLVERKLMSVNRLTDMLKIVDDELTPVIGWTECYSFVTLKFEATRKSLKHLLKHFMIDNKDAETEAVNHDIAENTKLDRVLVTPNFGDNRYALLYEDSFDSDDGFDDVQDVEVNSKTETDAITATTGDNVKTVEDVKDEAILTSTVIPEVTDPPVVDYAAMDDLFAMMSQPIVKPDPPVIVKEELVAAIDVPAVSDPFDIFGGFVLPAPTTVAIKTGFSAAGVLAGKDFPKEFTALIPSFLETLSTTEVKFSEVDSFVERFNEYCRSSYVTTEVDPEDNLADIN